MSRRMFRTLRQHRLLRLFWGFMALYLFNISVDVPDAASPQIPENLAINDIESVAEFVLEDVMCLDDAVPEHDDPDREDDPDGSGKKHVNLIFDLPISLVFQPAAPANAAGRLDGAGARLCLGCSPAVLVPPPEI